jgi:hypothetical protein
MLCAHPRPAEFPPPRFYNPTDERRERAIGRWLLHGIEARVGKVANTWSEPKTKQMTQGEDVIGEPGGVGVMLFDVEIGFVIEQSVEHMGKRPARLRLSA